MLKGLRFMDTPTDPLAASFDIVARQDAADQAIGALRSDVDEVKTRLDKVAKAAARPALAGGETTDAEVKGFVDGYLRHGRTGELKSLTQGVPAEGGYAVPQQIDALIANQLKQLSPIRAVAQVVQVGSSGYRKLIATGGTASGWVSETAARPETATPNFAEIAPPSGELYANPSASQAMLDDAVFDLETWPRARRSSGVRAPTSRSASCPRRPAPAAMRPGPSALCSSSPAAMPAASTPSPS
jgi:HK97 family phage major capsid protein